MKKKPRMSMQLRFSLIFTAVVLLIIVGIAVANSILLDKTYLAGKRSMLYDAYQTIDKFFVGDTDVDSLDLESIYSTKDITFYISDTEGTEVFSSIADANNIPEKPTSMPRGNAPSGEGGGQPPSGGEGGGGQPPSSGDGEAQPPEKPNNRGGEAGRGEGRPGGEKYDRNDYDFDIEHTVKNALEQYEVGQYKIDEMTDKRLGASFIQLAAKLNNGYVLYMRTPVTSTAEAANTANKLLMVIGAAALLLSFIIIIIVSGKVTKPIREITEIAKDMSELNFSRRYNGRSNDEIGDLGNSINTLSDHLEKSISELKASNARLEKDIELKTSVDEMRKEFIANASHEFKTPIALISSYAEGLRDNIAGTDEDRNYYCDVIIDETNRMDKIIRQFMTITELEAAQTCEKTEIDLGELVKGIVRKSSILAKKRGVSIALDLEGTFTVMGDEMALEQAVSNYITNAIHHVDERGIITVSLTRHGNKVRFSVFNSGAPIPEQGSERIWESFYKLDKAHTHSYGGSGLGLAIVKKSIELHGGTYGFNNTDDGVEFYFEI